MLMTQQIILYPVLALLTLILAIMLLTLTVRVSAAKAGKINPHRFRTMNLDGVDEKLVTPGRNFDNQFQLPILFLIFVLFCLQFSLVDSFFIIASWLFVASRYLHALIHVTSNNVIHRLGAFAMGAMVLFVCWGRLLWLVLA